MSHKTRTKLSASTLTLAIALLSFPLGLMPTQALAGAAAAVTPSGDLHGVDMFDGSLGWAVGADDRVYKTVDGGYSWTQQTQDQRALGDNRGVSFGSATQGVVVTDQESPETEYTTNSGDSWTKWALAPEGWTPNPETVLARDVTMISATTGYAVGTGDHDLGVIYKTTNGGASWTRVHRAAVYQVIEDIGGDPTLVDKYVKTDLHGIDFYDADNGWAVGYRATAAPDGSPVGAAIYRGAGSGSSWTTETVSGVANRLYSVAALSSSVAVGVGSLGKIVKRSGGTWTTRTSPVVTDLRDVDFWNTTHGVAVGAGGVVRTTDGGETWSSVLGSGLNLNSVSLTPGGWGLAVGNSGVILRTGDYGQTWTSALDTTRPVTSISPSSAWRNTDANVVLTASDTGSGVDKTYYTTDGTTPTAASTVYPEGGFTWSTQGVTTIKFRSVDVAGNMEDVRSGQIRIDKTKPITQVVGSSQTVYPDPCTIYLSPSDALSGIAGTTFSLDDEPETSGTVIPVTGVGSHHIDYYSRDAAGNTEDVRRFDFTIASDILDELPPETVSNITDGWKPNQFNVVLTSSDSGGGHVTATYYSTDGSYPTQTYPEGGFAVTAEGITTVKYFSVDSSDNTETPVNTEYVKVDKTKPVTTSDAKSYYDADTSVLLTPSDSPSGVAGTTYKLDGEDETSGTAVPVAGVGAHTIEYWSTDFAGLREDTKTASFYIREDPVLSDGTVGLGVVTTGYNAYYTHSAYLKNASGAPLPGKAVYLQYSSDNKNWYYHSGTASDAGGGLYTYRARTTSKRYYRFVFKGDTQYKVSRGTSATLYPYVYLSRPSGPSTATRGRTYSWYGYLKPRHTAGATGNVKLYFYRYQSGAWVLRKTAKARNYNYSSYTKYRARTYLPYTGSWKVKAYHRYDSKNASTSSSYKSFRVR